MNSTMVKLMSEDGLFDPDEAHPLVKRLVMTALEANKTLKSFDARLVEVEMRLGLRKEETESSKWDF